jgi:DNA mismatch repair ATPase MutS
MNVDFKIVVGKLQCNFALAFITHKSHTYVGAFHIAVRLVESGYKVGIVRQTETAALKAASENRSKPFSRALSEVYTRGTLVGDAFDDNEIQASTQVNMPSDGFIVCILESQEANNAVSFAFLVCVDFASQLHSQEV